MPTIKRKVEMNLVQIIEYVWENDIKDKLFYCREDNVTKHIIYISPSGRINLDSECYYEKTDVFTVETEEEITEDTEFDIIVLIEKDGCSATWGNSSINKLKDNNSKEFHAYIDGGFKLIWTKEEGLVE